MDEEGCGGREGGREGKDAGVMEIRWLQLVKVSVTVSARVSVRVWVRVRVRVSVRADSTVL